MSLSLSLRDPLASILIGVNPNKFNLQGLNIDHFILIIQEKVKESFEKYQVKCFSSVELNEKYFIDIHNAQKFFEIARIRNTNPPLSEVYFPEIESKIYNLLNLIEYDLVDKDKMTQATIRLNKLFTPVDLKQRIVNEFLFCENQIHANLKVAEANKLLINSHYDFSGFSFCVNYSNPIELYLSDYQGLALGLFKSDINLSIIGRWINLVGNIRKQAINLGKKYTTEKSEFIRNKYGRLIPPNISDDKILELGNYNLLLTDTIKAIDSLNTEYAILEVEQSVHAFFVQGFHEGISKVIFEKSL